jgi:hypothetical protein
MVLLSASDVVVVMLSMAVVLDESDVAIVVSVAMVVGVGSVVVSVAVNAFEAVEEFLV